MEAFNKNISQNSFPSPQLHHESLTGEWWIQRWGPMGQPWCCHCIIAWPHVSTPYSYSFSLGPRYFINRKNYSIASAVPSSPIETPWQVRKPPLQGSSIPRWDCDLKVSWSGIPNLSVSKKLVSRWAQLPTGFIYSIWIMEGTLRRTAVHLLGYCINQLLWTITPIANHCEIQ